VTASSTIGALFTIHEKNRWQIMFPVSGFSPQVSSGFETKEAPAVPPGEAPSKEPEDTFLPSSSLEGGEEGIAIGDRGALVREDLKGKGFLKLETEHFIFFYMPGTEAERDISDIAEKREQGYGIIGSFLAVEAPDKTSIYLFPSDIDSFCPTWKKTFAGRTIPEARMIGLAYIADEGSYEKVNIGHELTHALEFDLLPASRRVPPYLREGIADYLCLSGVDMHQRFASFLSAGMVEKPFSLTQEKLNRAEYMESASFVQFLIGAWGAPSFLNLYRETAVLRKGEVMSISDFESLVTQHLGTDCASLESHWKATVMALLRGAQTIRQAPEEDRVEILQLMRAMERVTREGSDAELLLLYSSDFYYRTPAEERELAARHRESCQDFIAGAIELQSLGTWCYGRTYAVKASSGSGNSASASPEGNPRGFLVERICGQWRLNAKYIGGWIGKDYVMP
jgi:hypothetical protein